jgi:uncharacterized membrane protein YphA (DoxX/SURF4 family)
MASTVVNVPADPAVAAEDRAGGAAERWLAVLRVVIGFWFAKGLVTKLTIGLVGGVLPVPMASGRWLAVMPRLLRGYAASTPLVWYHDFATTLVLPHATLFAQLTALGEVAAGLGLMLGLLTPAAAAGALLLVLNYGLATLGAGSCQPGFHLMLATGLLAVLGARAGRTWGLDGWLAGRRERRLTS